LAAYTTPGVYYERMDATAPGISAIRTDVAGFAGIAVSGPLDTPVPVQSWKQFQAYFGGFSGSGFLAYAVRGFFENGGRRCWVVRVASNDPIGGAQAAGLELASTVPGRAVWNVNASSPGTWGNSLTVSVRETHQAQTAGWLEKDHPERMIVSSTTGFARGTLVRLSQPGKSALRVVAALDTALGFVGAVPGATQFLVWTPERPELRLPYDASPLDFAPGQSIQVESVEYTVIVEQGGIPIALYPGLSLIPESGKYGPAALPALTIPMDAQNRQMLPPVPEPVVIEELRPEFTADSTAAFRPLEQIQLPPESVLLRGGQEGLRLLTAYDFMGEPVDPLDSDLVKKSKLRGLRALETIDEVSILAVPDINIQPLALPPIEPLPPCVPDPCLPTALSPAAPVPPPQDIELPPAFSDADIYRVQAAMVEQCEETRSRVAVLEPPFSAVNDPRLGISAVQSWRNQFDSKYAALYFPWLRVVDPLRSATASTRDVPPSGHVAGQYARTDLAIGVHKAPANAPLAWVQDVTIPVDDARHGVLNPLGVNAVRALPGRGIRIFGARTISSDPDWRYINVRRLMIMIEKAIYLSTQWAVFEPNDEITQAKLRLSLTSFLLALWQKGALAGSVAEAAFFVRCDQTTNPASQRADGQMLALVGVAPVNPFEFVVVRVGRTENQFELLEQTSGTGVR
jgi:phage tail sheath protein FI